MRVPFIDKLLQQITHPTDQSHQSERDYSQHDHKVPSHSKEHVLPSIVALNPEIFNDVYSLWQLRPSSQLTTNDDGLDSTHALESRRLVLSTEQQKAIKQAIDALDLHKLQCFIGPALAEMKLIRNISGNYKAWVFSCLDLLVTYAIEDILSIVVNTLKASKPAWKGELSDQEVGCLKQYFQTLETSLIDKASEVIEGFIPNHALPLGTKQEFIDHFHKCVSDSVYWLFIDRNSPPDFLDSIPDPYFYPSIPKVYPPPNVYHELNRLSNSRWSAEQTIKTAHQKQVHFIAARNQMDVSAAWKEFAKKLYQAGAFPDADSLDGVLEQLQPLQASGIASQALGTTLLIDTSNQTLSIMDYALQKLKQATPCDQGLCLILIDYLIKRGALLTESHNNPPDHEDSTRILQKRLLEDPILVAHQWRYLKKYGLLQFLNEKHISDVLVFKPSWIFDIYCKLEHISACEDYSFIELLCNFVKAEKIPIKHMKLGELDTVRSMRFEQLQFRLIALLDMIKKSIPTLNTLDARSISLKSTDFLESCEWIEKHKPPFTIKVGGHTPSQDKRLTIPTLVTLNPAMAQVVNYAAKHSLLSHPFLERLERFQRMHEPQKLLPVFELLKNHKLDTAWAIHFLMKEPAYWELLSSIIGAAHSHNVLSTGFLSHLQYFIRDEYAVLDYLSKQRISDDTLLLLARYPCAVKNFSQWLGCELDKPFNAEELEAERDAIDWRAQLEHEFDLYSDQAEASQCVTSQNWMELYFKRLTARESKSEIYIDSITDLLGPKGILSEDENRANPYDLEKAKKHANPDEQHQGSAPNTSPIGVSFVKEKFESEHPPWHIDTLALKGNLTLIEFEALMLKLKKCRYLDLDGRIGHSRGLDFNLGSRVDALVRLIQCSRPLRHLKLSKSGFASQDYAALIKALNARKAPLFVDVTHFHPHDKKMVAQLSETSAHRHTRAWLMGETLSLSQHTRDIQTLESFKALDPETVSLPEALTGLLETLRAVSRAFGPVSGDDTWVKAIEKKAKKKKQLSKLEHYCIQAKQVTEVINNVAPDLRMLIACYDPNDKSSKNYQRLCEIWRELMKGLGLFSLGLTEADFNNLESEVKKEAASESKAKEKTFSVKPYPNIRLLNLLHQAMRCEVAWGEQFIEKTGKSGYKEWVEFIKPLECTLTATKMAASKDIDNKGLKETNLILMGLSALYDFAKGVMSAFPQTAGIAYAAVLVEKLATVSEIPEMIIIIEKFSAAEFLLEKGRDLKKKIEKLGGEHLFRSAVDNLNRAFSPLYAADRTGALEAIFYRLHQSFEKQLSGSSKAYRQFFFVTLAEHLVEQFKNEVFELRDGADKAQVRDDFVQTALLQLYFLKEPARGLAGSPFHSSKLLHYLLVPELICEKERLDGLGGKEIHAFRFKRIRLRRPGKKKEEIIDIEKLLKEVGPEQVKAYGSRHASAYEVALFNELVNAPNKIKPDLTFEKTIRFPVGTSQGEKDCPAVITLGWQAQSRAEVDVLKDYQFEPIPLKCKQPQVQQKMPLRKVPIPIIPELFSVGMPGDDHCFFHGVRFALGHEPDDSRSKSEAEIKAFRKALVDYMSTEENRVRFGHIWINENKGNAMGPDCPKYESYDEYLTDMLGTKWGGGPEIRVLEEMYNRPIVIMNTKTDAIIANTLGQMDGEPILLRYNGINHYDAVVVKEGYTARDVIQELLQQKQHKKQKHNLSNKVPKKSALKLYDENGEDKDIKDTINDSKNNQGKRGKKGQDISIAVLKAQINYLCRRCNIPVDSIPQEGYEESDSEYESAAEELPARQSNPHNLFYRRPGEERAHDRPVANHPDDPMKPGGRRKSI